MNDAPGPMAIQTALATWASTRSRLLSEDPDLANDEAQLVTLLGSECEDLTEIEHRLARAIVTASAMAEMAESMADNLLERRDRYKRRVMQYKAALLGILDATGERRAEFPDCTISTRAGPPAVIVTDETSIPERFIRTEVSRRIDKAGLLAVLRAGEIVEGALLSNPMPSITVRSK